MPNAQADLQVFLDRELRENLAALRHVADAEARPLLRRGCARRSLPSNRISPDAAGSSPMMHLSSVVLPMPLRPIRHVRDPAGTSRLTSHKVWLPP